MLFSLILAWLSSAALAAPTTSPDQSFARLNFVKVEKTDVATSLTALNERDLYYLVDLEIGTPAQSVKVMLDTGSSDLVINSVTNPYCNPTSNSSAILAKNNAAGGSRAASSSQTSGVTSGQTTDGQTTDGQTSDDQNSDNQTTNGYSSLQQRKNVYRPPTVILEKRKNVYKAGRVNDLGEGVQGKNILSAILGQGHQADCFEHGFFAANLSSSYQDLDQDMSIIYGDGTFVQGSYAKEKISFGDISYSGAQFGLIEKGDSDLGVLGMSVPELESSYSSSKKSYDNFPVWIAKQNKLSTISYSINLSTEDKTGTIIFGAVDQSKYKGDFVTRPFENYQGEPGFFIDIDSIELHYDDGTSNTTTTTTTTTNTKSKYPPDLKFIRGAKKIKALVDSGSTLNAFPQDIYTLMQTYIPHDSVTNTGLVVDCDILSNPKNYVRYTFDQLKIDVPFAEFNVTSAAKNGKCTFGMSSSDQKGTLGDPFFRSSYLYFDLTRKQISIAQYVRNGGPEKLKKIA